MIEELLKIIKTCPQCKERACHIDENKCYSCIVEGLENIVIITEEYDCACSYKYEIHEVFDSPKPISMYAICEYCGDEKTILRMTHKEFHNFKNCIIIVEEYP